MLKCVKLYSATRERMMQEHKFSCAAHARDVRGAPPPYSKRSSTQVVWTCLGEISSFVHGWIRQEGVDNRLFTIPTHSVLCSAATIIGRRFPEGSEVLGEI